jgi:hypothetical protein
MFPPWRVQFSGLHVHAMADVEFLMRQPCGKLAKIGFIPQPMLVKHDDACSEFLGRIIMVTFFNNDGCFAKTAA